MKRRTFLRLSSATLASLGLSACGAKPATSVPSAFESPSDSYVDIIDGGDDSLGMTLEEAQEYSSYYNCPYFIHRADGLFYPLAVPLIPYAFSFTTHTKKSSLGSESYTTLDTNAVFLDSDQRNYYNDSYYLNVSSGDELVFISSTFKAPETVELLRCYQTHPTISATFSDSQKYAQIFPLMEHRYDLYASTSLDQQPYFKKDRHCYALQLLPGQTGEQGQIIQNCGPITFNGASFNDFLNQTLVYEATPDTGYLKLTDYPSSTLSVGYYEGSSYNTIDFDISTTTFNFDYEKPTDYGTSELTQNGYTLIHLDSLADNHYYLISGALDYGNTTASLPLFYMLYVQP